MLTPFPVALLVGAILGILSGLGVGGGSLLILWLTMAAQVPAETSRMVNLLFFVTVAGTVTLLRIKRKAFHWKRLPSGMLAGCCATAVFVVLGNRLDPELLKKGFGILLLGIGLRELFYRPRKKQ